MKTILILGSTGMAGHMIYYNLKNAKKYNVVNVSYRKKLTDDSKVIDIKNTAELEQLMISVNPDYIINCIGVLIKNSADIENTIFINAYFPHFLKKLADNINAKVIHISTDCVFSGKDGNYQEDSITDADDIYGRTKALGEVNECHHLTIRTSIIGPELKSNGEGLFHWFMSQTGEITGFTNAIWSGVTTLELAKAIESYLDNDNLSGIIHLTNGIEISKYDLLNLIKAIWKVDHIKVVAGIGKNVNKSLAKSQISKHDVPSYEQMLKELFIWMKNNSTLYKYSF